MMALHAYKVGDRIRVSNQKRPFIVRAVSDRYAICTKPFNAQRTVLYCIIDFQEKWRAPNSFVFSPYNYAVQGDIDQCLQDLIAGECELSRRHGIALDIVN